MSKKDGSQIKLPAGSINVKASAPGYHEISRRIKISSNSTVTIRLYPHRPLQESSSPSSLYDGTRWCPAVAWQPQSSLVIGLGGTGRYVLTYLKKNLLDAGAGKISDKVRLTLLDTSDYELLEGQQVPISFAGVSLAKEDVVELGEDLNALKDRLRIHPETDPDLSSWFPADNYHLRLGADELNLENGTRQRRPLARAMLVQDLNKGIPLNGVDVVLLLDQSQSMGEPFSESQPSVSKLMAVQEVAVAFLSQMDETVDRVAVVAFNETSHVLVPLSNEFLTATEKIRSLESDGQPSIHTALDAANNVFDDTAERIRIVVLLSDGQSDNQKAVESARQLNHKNVHIVSIGIGNTNESLLREVATKRNNKPDYFYALDAESLKRIYVQLARRMGDGSRIWRLLHGAAASALDDGTLRVIIVGSLAGGFGSAILADVAYLSKRIGQSLGAKSISIEAYLATDGVFNRIAPRLDVLEANTFASIREIERFQLAQGFPFRLIYNRNNPENEVLFGKIEWRLLDEIYLFDHLPNITPQNERQKEGWYQPALSVFPAMADAISFSLDKASRTGALTQYRRAIQGDATAEQWAQGRAVVGSVGVYRYHLPARDVFDLLKVQWVYALLQTLMTGNNNDGFRLDPTQNQEESVKDLDRHVRLFLLGYAGYEDPACPVGLALIGKIIVEGRSILDEINADLATIGSEEISSYEKYLNSAILVMLNGLKTSNVRIARAGKVGYILEFLKLLTEFLKDAEAILSSVSSYEDLVKQYLQVTARAEKAVRESLFTISKSYGSLDNTPDGLLEILEKKKQQTHDALREQDAILTRQSILSPTDIDLWYQVYFSDPAYMDEILSRLQWIQIENGFALSIRAWGVYKLSDVSERGLFIDELLSLAGYAGRKLLEKETLAVWLQKKLKYQEQVEQITTLGLQCSAPLLTFSEQMAPQAKYSLTMGLNAESEAQTLESSIRKGLIAERKLIRLETTDPYALTITQMMDVIPVDAIDSVRNARQTYSLWYGLLPSSTPDERAEPTAVFRAEKIALILERRLQKELHQASRIFAPIILTALDSGLPARLFALAFASGWIRTGDNKIILTAPGLRSIEVDIPEQGNLSRDFSPYVLGLVNFVTQVLPAHVNELQNALGQSDLNLWRNWTSTDEWRESELAKVLLSARTPDAEDFASIVALVVRDEYVKRMKPVA